jgi:glycosyltransferase involved in cell wall biosynthesis
MPQEIAEADVCLAGHFSNIGKAKRVIPGKAYQFIAMRKPVIAANNAANRELFRDRVNAMFCEIEDARSLADSILELKRNKELRDKISENGYRTFKKECTPKVVGAEIKKIMEKLV